MGPEDKIRDRIMSLEAMKANYLGYLKFRISDQDWHGTWDAGVNISEVEAEMSGLRYALACIEGDA